MSEEKIDDIAEELKVLQRGYSKVHLWEYQKIKQLEERISRLEEKLQGRT